MASYRRRLDGSGLEVEPSTAGASGGRDLGLCEAALPSFNAVFGQSWVPICSNPATETWDYGCVHEHVKRRRTCRLHRPAPDQVGCRECFEAGHECPLVARQMRES